MSSLGSETSQLSCEFELSKAAARKVRITSACQQANQVNHQSEVKKSEQAEYVKKPSSYSASQPANQPTNQQTNQSINRPTDQATDQPANQRTNQLISWPTNHGADLANYSQNKWLRPPLPRKLIVRKGGREDGSLLGVSNQLKIGYD